MKLLLTSGGITTPALAEELNKMVDRGGKRLAFVPTAANAEPNGPWFLGQVDNLRRFGFDQIDFVDPSAADLDWRERLKAADIIFVSGGNTFHLLDQTRKTGFGDWIKQNIATKVYLGSSAGSILATPSIAIASVENVDRNITGLKDLSGLGLVNFEIVPHMPEMLTQESVEKYAKSTKNKVYAINDRSAISIINGEVKAIHSGKFWQYN